MKNFIIARHSDLTPDERQKYSGSGYLYREFGLYFLAGEMHSKEELLMIEDDKYFVVVIGRALPLKNFEKVFRVKEAELGWADTARTVPKWFDELNGICAFLIFNKIELRLRILTDPMGFYPCMIWQNGQDLIFSDQLQYLLAHRRSELKWNEESLDLFYQNGHFISGQSWYQNLTRSLPATVIEVDLMDHTLKTWYYWGWNENNNIELSKNELVARYIQEFADFFRCLPDEFSSWGVALSGGLDSRWVVYELKERFKTIRAFSFGEEDAIDLKIASAVCRELGIPWNKYQIVHKNWIQNRLERIWLTGGLLSIQHFHEDDIYYDLSNHYDIIATGFYGGGIYSNANTAGKAINPLIARQWFHFGKADDLTHLPYFNTPHIDPYISTQRIANSGAIHMHYLGKKIKTCLPFCNMKWLRYNYAVQDVMQLNHRLYLNAINQRWPLSIRNMPWQKTMLPVARSVLNQWMLKTRVYKLQDNYFQWTGRSKTFVDYHFIIQEMKEYLAGMRPDWQPPHKPRTTDDYFRWLTIALWMEMNRQNKYNVL